MEEKKKLGWIFSADGAEGIPVLKCPYCGRQISGKKAILASISLENCPECTKKLHFDDITEEDWLYMDSYFGEN